MGKDILGQCRENGLKVGALGSRGHDDKVFGKDFNDLKNENTQLYLELNHFPAEGAFVMFVMFALFGLLLLLLQAQPEDDVDSSRSLNDLHFVLDPTSINSLLGTFAAVIRVLCSYAGCCLIHINNATRAKTIYLHHRTFATRD